MIEAAALDTHCPVCGQMLPPHSGGVVDLNTNTAIVDSHVIALEPKEAEILSILVARAPRLVRRDSMLSMVHGADGGPLTGAQELQVYICRLRKKLAGTCPEIVTHWGKGYSARFNG